MQIASTQNASPLPVAPAAPGANGMMGQDSPFAKILSAQKQPAATPQETNGTRCEAHQSQATTDADTQAADTAGAEGSPTDADKSQAAVRRGGARNASKQVVRGHERHASKTDAHDKAAKAEAGAEESTKNTDKKDTLPEPGAAELAAMNRPLTDPTLAPHSVAAAGTAPGVPPLAGDSTAGAPALPVDGTVQPTAVGTHGSQDTGRIDPADAKRDTTFADMAAEAAKASEATRRASGDETLDQKAGLDRMERRFELPSLHELSGAGHVAAAHHPPHADNVSAPVAVTVATPATSPEFKESLGVQVSVLARDGVQHAELHLHPADMGPISVQIALEGTRAQVDFGADSLATRQIIESGLPELASALRDAGFTLAGGGVSQHARQQQEREGGQPAAQGVRRVSASGDAAQAAVRRATVRMSQGGVDLYA